MKPNARKPKVIIRHCDEYDPRAHPRDRPRGPRGARPARRAGARWSSRTSSRAGDAFPHAYTRPEFVEGVLRALRDRDGGDDDRARGRRALRHHRADARRASSESGYGRDAQALEGQALLLRGRAAGRDPAHATRAGCATTCSRPSRSRKRRLLRELPQVQGAPVDDGDVLDEDLHRHPGRPPPPDRSRPQLNEKIADLQYIIQPQFIAIDAITAGEGRMLTPMPFTAEPHHHGQQPGRVRRGVLPHHRRRPATVDHIRLPHERGFGTADARRDRDHRRRHARGGASSARRASRSASSASRSTSRARTSPRTRARRPRPRASDYCWGGCPGAIEEAIEILRLYDKESDAEDAAPARRVRQLRGPARREARREGRLHRRLRRVARARSATSSSRSRTSTRTAARSIRTRSSTTTSSPRWWKTERHRAQGQGQGSTCASRAAR